MPEESLLFHSWTETYRAAPHARLLVDVASGKTWTREELATAAHVWSEQHRASVAHQVVALAEPNGVEWLKIFLGLLECSAVIAPLEPGEPLTAQQATARSIGAAWLWREGQLTALEKSRRPRADGRRLIKLTSGSTGAPRPLVFTDAEMLADGRQIAGVMGIKADDTNFGLIPWGHSYGLGNLIVPLLLQGTGIVYGAAPLPHAIGSACEQWKPTVFPAVPALLRALAESTVPPEQLSSLRTVISAGAPLAPEIAQSFEKKFGRKIHSFYGSSETGGMSYDVSGDSAASGRGVGRPIPGVQFEFERGRRFAVSSPAVFTIGNRRPGRHQLADFGQLSDAGELVLLGRSGRFVKIAGRRLNLAEVEHALKQVSGVDDAFVVTHAERADALAAAVCSARSPAEIREELRTRLASWKIPKRILALPNFPLTPRGKTDARQLRELLNRPSEA
jgi:acyl-CoA synthetase (AMP-forming)/AMP-acid ligase II